MALRPPRRWSFFKRVQQRLRRAGVPRSAAYRLVSHAAAVTAPRETLRRYSAARRLADEPATLRPVPHSDGFTQFGTGALPGSERAVELCEEIFAHADREKPSLRAGYQKEDFLVPLLRNEHFGSHPELLKFLLSPAILQVASGYLGAVPVLSRVSLWWSPVNDSTRSSQRFHYDLEDMSQLKLLLNVLDVDGTSGPFTLIPADTSRRIVHQIGYDGGRIDDVAVAATGEANAIKPITGPAGAGAFVDTSRCLHFGSRGNERNRLVLMAQYLRYDAPNFRPTQWEGAVKSSGIELEPLERMALIL